MQIGPFQNFAVQSSSLIGNRRFPLSFTSNKRAFVSSYVDSIQEIILNTYPQTMYYDKSPLSGPLLFRMLIHNIAANSLFELGIRPRVYCVNKLRR